MRDYYDCSVYKMFTVLLGLCQWALQKKYCRTKDKLIRLHRRELYGANGSNDMVTHT